MKKNKTSVAWFIPELLNGSAGHRTIFQNINILIKEGYNCDVYVVDEKKYTNEELFNMINDYYGDFEGSVYSNYDDISKK